ncbi:unnamed protein product [Cladocopium goreaui]|uniref:Class I SAM-dependent methyltransferase n=1 Tax=Cladocopium goreaui TaxID=2562237 RepID=A0A9P1CEG5_9DINO|nr:unnamed protein product [Cladocopium goreaui]
MQLFQPCGSWIWLAQILVLEALRCPHQRQLKVCCSSGSLPDGVRGHPDCVQRGMDWMACCQPKGYKADVKLLAWNRNHSNDASAGTMRLPDPDQKNDFGRLWASIRQTLPDDLKPELLQRVFNELFGLGWEHPSWSVLQADPSDHTRVLATCDLFPVGSGPQTLLILSRLRMIQPIAMLLWATKEIALALFHGTSIRRGLSVLQSATILARRMVRGANDYKEMWPFERPLSYIRALANVPDHAQKVRAATETGDFLKVAQRNQLFAIFLHNLEHLMISSAKLPQRNGLIQAPFPVTFNDSVCCHRSSVLKMLLAELRAEHPTETLHVAEVGVGWGSSSFYTMNSDANLQYLGVDNYLFYGKVADAATPLPRWVKRAQGSAEQIFHRFGGKLVDDFSENAAKGVANQSLDMLFIDGAHRFREVHKDLLKWQPKVKPGGYLIGHDHNADWPGVSRALCRIRQNKPISFGADFTYWWRV